MSLDSDISSRSIAVESVRLVELEEVDDDDPLRILPLMEPKNLHK
jgi:hypothetical protein